MPEALTCERLKTGGSISIASPLSQADYPKLQAAYRAQKRRAADAEAAQVVAHIPTPPPLEHRRLAEPLQQALAEDPEFRHLQVLPTHLGGRDCCALLPAACVPERRLAP